MNNQNKTFEKVSNRDWEGGSVSRALALQSRGLKFRPQHPHKKSGTAARGEVEAALLGPAGCQPSCRVSERPCLGGIRQGVCDRGRDTQSPPLASTGAHTCAHTHHYLTYGKSIQSTLCTHTCTHTHERTHTYTCARTVILHIEKVYDLL